MGETFVIRDLMTRLRNDDLRTTAPFSTELDKVNRALIHPYATDGDRDDALLPWFQRHQPCVFGRVAAAMGTLQCHYLLDRDLDNSDQHIAARIQEGLLAWKRRSLSPAPAISTPAHGFVLILASSRLIYAEPNDALYQLAQEILRLWGCASTSEAHGTVYWEDLYLQEPTQKSYVKFTFSVDFFAAAGDQRWWQDHRIPGGLGFTANSLGHMRRYREWYLGKTAQDEWTLAMAMKTIADAADTKHGRATWLRDLNKGVPFVPEVACPFASTRPELVGKDWTRYSGHLHTDHSVRRELLQPSIGKSAEIIRDEWLQDLQYLYDAKNIDNRRFVAGVQVADDEVVERIGSPQDFVRIHGPRSRPGRAGIDESLDSVNSELDMLLADCRKWKLAPEELRELAGL